VYADVPEQDQDRVFIESMVTWGDFSPLGARFNPEGDATRATADKGNAFLDLTAMEIVRHLEDWVLKAK
jgi:creatinine amidohydrolase/Fe(II)-dependent formamide hydrolase-like protein